MKRPVIEKMLSELDPNVVYPVLMEGQVEGDVTKHFFIAAYEVVYDSTQDSEIKKLVSLKLTDGETEYSRLPELLGDNRKVVTTIQNMDLGETLYVRYKDRDTNSNVIEQIEEGEIKIFHLRIGTSIELLMNYNNFTLNGEYYYSDLVAQPYKPCFHIVAESRSLDVYKGDKTYKSGVTGFECYITPVPDTLEYTVSYSDLVKYGDWSPIELGNIITTAVITANSFLPFTWQFGSSTIIFTFNTQPTVGVSFTGIVLQFGQND